MINKLVDTLAPDYCYGCGIIGAILCPSCFYDIVSEPFNRCLDCLRPTGAGAICSSCRLPYQKGWTAGWRQGPLERLVDASKFDRVQRGCRVQAELLAALLPQLPDQAVVVAVPTTRPHIRQRGYGHTEAIADHLARLRNLPYRQLLHRTVHSVQHGASRSVRQKQAQQAYQADAGLDNQTTYLLVDDVYTTGYTAKYAARALRRAGAKNIWLAVTSLQPLD